MPMKACGRAPVLPASGYTQLDTINGSCRITFANQTNSTINIVTNVASAGDAASEETALRYVQIPANAAAVYTINANPATTWIKWNGATVGTNWYTFFLEW